MRFYKLTGVTFLSILLFATVMIAHAKPMAKVASEDIKVFINQNKMWQYKESRLTATFSFKGGFGAAVDFVRSLVAPSDKMNHHPDLNITYNRVKVSLTTHDVGGITAADLELAKVIQAAYNQQRHQ